MPEAMLQFEMYFTNEYTKEILAGLAEAMGLPFKEADVERAMRESDAQSSGNILLIKGGQRFICVDCNNKDWIFPLIVRCDEREGKRVKEMMEKWDDRIRAEYGQELSGGIPDVYGADDHLLKQIERYYHISL